MDVNLPSISELSQMQFLPGAQYQQARDQIGLAKQFQDQNLRTGELDIRKKLLDNMFQEQDDPNKVQSRALLNTNQDIKNKSMGFEFDVANANKDEAIKAGKWKFMADMSSNQLADLYSKAELDYQNNDNPPEKRALAKDALMNSYKMLQERQKQEAAQKNTETLVGGRQSVAETAAGSRERAAQIAADAKLAYGQLAKDAKNKNEWDIYSTAKTPDAQAAAAANGAAKAIARGDEAAAAQWNNLANYHRADAQNRVVAGAQARQANSPDLGELGVPTVGATPPMRPAPPMPAPQGPAAVARGPNSGGERPLTFDLGPNMERVPGIKAAIVEAAKTDPTGAAEALRQLDKQIAFEKGDKKEATPTVRADGKVNVINPNGDPGWIKKSDLDEAIKNGWKIK
jgi:hypothetical protein